MPAGSPCHCATPGEPFESHGFCKLPLFVDERSATMDTGFTLALEIASTDGLLWLL